MCIEENLELRLPDRVWIERGDNRGFRPIVIYKKRPVFFASAVHLGHSYDKCTSRTSSPPPLVVVPPPIQPPHPTTGKVDKCNDNVIFVDPRK